MWAATRHRYVVMIGACVASAGCASGKRDAFSPDRVIARVDSGVRDGRFIGTDARRDALPADALRGDARQPADLRAADAAVDAAAGGPCNALLARAVGVTNDVTVVCEAAGNVTQCAAQNLCNTAAGFRLCTASQYKQRLFAAPQAGAWIAGCVVTDGFAHAPRDGLCKCDLVTGAQIEHTWRCDALYGESSNTLHVGLKTDTTCYKVGVNDPANAAFWRAQPIGLPLNRAICCR